MELKSGRFGPYASWGALKQAVPRDLLESVDQLPQDIVWDLLRAKREGICGASITPEAALAPRGKSVKRTAKKRKAAPAAGRKKIPGKQAAASKQVKPPE